MIYINQSLQYIFKTLFDIGIEFYYNKVNCILSGNFQGYRYMIHINKEHILMKLRLLLEPTCSNIWQMKSITSINRLNGKLSLNHVQKSNACTFIRI